MTIARTSMGSQLTTGYHKTDGTMMKVQSIKLGDRLCQKRYASPIENTQSSGEEVSSC
jgi:hypothetical protein